MPPKLRNLIAQLEAAGFQDRGGKGSHRNYRHPSGISVTLSGRAGDDAKKYQLRDVGKALEKVRDENER